MMPSIDLAEFVGIPYVNQGRDPALGLDCWGLPMWWYARQYGIELPSLLDGYTSANDREQVAHLVSLQSQQWRRVEAPHQGDLVTLKHKRGTPWHVGIYLHGQRMLHTADGIGSCIEFLQTPRWANRIDSYWRHQARG